MNVRVVIDQLVVSDIAMSPLDARRLRTSLQHALAAELTARAQSRDLPTARGAARESLQIRLASSANGQQIGTKLGASLADHVWNGTGVERQMRPH
jgi:hypothetical protein